MSETKLTFLANGPILVAGPFALLDAAGQKIETGDEPFALCRCGASANKPFCDGAHQKIDFQAD